LPAPWPPATGGRREKPPRRKACTWNGYFIDRCFAKDEQNLLNFDLHIPTRIVFGRKARGKIGKALKPYAGRRFCIAAAVPLGNIKTSRLIKRGAFILPETPKWLWGKPFSPAFMNMKNTASAAREISLAALAVFMNPSSFEAQGFCIALRRPI
jgi:hypothetical protein